MQQPPRPLLIQAPFLSGGGGEARPWEGREKVPTLTHSDLIPLLSLCCPLLSPSSVPFFLLGTPRGSQGSRFRSPPRLGPSLPLNTKRGGLLTCFPRLGEIRKRAKRARGHPTELRGGKHNNNNNSHSLDPLPPPQEMPDPSIRNRAHNSSSSSSSSSSSTF